MRSLRSPGVVLVVALASVARADVVIGGALGASVPSDRLEGKYVAGVAFDGLVALPVTLPLIELRPAVIVSYGRFGNARDEARPVWFYRAALGGDVRIAGSPLTPLVGAHYGHAWGNGKTLSTAYVRGATFDVELGLDLALDPSVEVGTRLRRVTIVGDEADDARYWTAGLHAAITY